jgi:hypothetical protein
MEQCPFCNLPASLAGAMLPHLLLYHAAVGGRGNYFTVPRINGHWLHIDRPDNEASRKIWCWCGRAFEAYFVPGSRPKRWVSADINFLRHLEDAGGLEAHLLELGMGIMGE